MRVLWAAAVVGVSVGVAGCTSVKMVQRDGCWVRETKKLGVVKEELGPCAAPTPTWSDDRLTRLVQECTARADQRWRAHAISAFQRRAALPPDATDEAVRSACVADATKLAVTENEALVAETVALKAKLAAGDAEREALRAQAAKEHEALVERVAKDHEAFVSRDAKERDVLAESTSKLADYLGQAANKPTQPAVATATASSDGRARMDSEQQQPFASAVPSTAPVAPAAIISLRAEPAPAAPAACAAPPVEEAAVARAPNAPARKVKAGRAPSRLAQANKGGCEVPATAAMPATKTAAVAPAATAPAPAGTTAAATPTPTPTTTAVAPKPPLAETEGTGSSAAPPDARSP